MSQNCTQGDTQMACNIYIYEISPTDHPDWTQVTTQFRCTEVVVLCISKTDWNVVVVHQRRGTWKLKILLAISSRRSSPSRTNAEWMRGREAARRRPMVMMRCTRLIINIKLSKIPFQDVTWILMTNTEAGHAPKKIERETESAQDTRDEVETGKTVTKMQWTMHCNLVATKVFEVGGG